MRRITAVLAAVVLVVALASLAFASEKMKGVIKTVDEKAGTIVLTSGGKDLTLKADKSVDLGKLKEGQKVVAEVENDTVTKVKKARRRVPVGC